MLAPGVPPLIQPPQAQAAPIQGPTADASLLDLKFPQAGEFAGDVAMGAAALAIFLPAVQKMLKFIYGQRPGEGALP